MEKFTAWMEEHFVPIAAKIGSQKYLVAVRDAFISIMPVTMAGSIAVLLNALVRDLPAKFELTGITEAFGWLISINGNVWWGTLAMLALVFAFAIGYQICKVNDVNPLAGGLVSFASFIIVTPQTATVGLDVTEATSAVTTFLTGAGATLVEGAETVTANIAGWGFLPSAYLDAKGLFTALLIGFISALIFAKLMQRDITIKLPEQVPPAVSKAFASIIPGVIAMYACGLLAYGCTQLTQSSIGDLILKYVQMPFLAMSQGLGAIIIITMCVSIFWFFGLHGSNVLAPALDGVYKTALTANTNFYNTNLTTEGLPYIWTRGSFDAYAWMGGAGCTLALIIAIFIFSKRAETRKVAQLSAPMGLFNINEPVVFGLPIVLNPIYIIPWVFVPTILVIIAYAATSMGLVPPVFLEVPWVMPPILYAWMGTGFSFAAALLSLINLVLGTLMWAVFVIIANKVDYNNTDNAEVEEDDDEALSFD